MEATLLERLDRMPPAMCRLLARTGPRKFQRPMTNREIAAKSKLDPSTIARLSKLKTWKHITLGTYQAFTSACGVDPLCAKDHRRLLKRKDAKLAYWRNATPRQQRMITRIQSEFTGGRASAPAGASNAPAAIGHTSAEGSPRLLHLHD